MFSSCVFSQVRWQYQADGPITGKPVIHDNRVYITSGKSLIALDKSGQLVWQYNLNANSYSSVAINKDSIYVLANNDLHALTINGERKWFYPTTDKAKKIEGELWGLEQGMVTDVWSWYRSAPLLIDNKVIFGNAGGTYAISTQNGDVLWHLNTGVTHTKPIVTNNSVVIGSWNKNLYAINHDNGKVKWKFTSTEGFNLDPTV